MANKQTAAQRHTAAHSKRRANRLENRPQPKLQGFVGSGVVVVADADGTLYRIDCEMGTIRRLCWEQ